MSEREKPKAKEVKTEKQFDRAIQNAPKGEVNLDSKPAGIEVSDEASFEQSMQGVDKLAGDVKVPKVIMSNNGVLRAKDKYFN